MTRSPSVGRSLRERASATSTATALRLSLAPGTGPRRPMSAKAAAAIALMTVPVARRAREPVPLPIATSAGPATTGHPSGGVSLLASPTPRERGGSTRGRGGGGGDTERRGVGAERGLVLDLHAQPASLEPPRDEVRRLPFARRGRRPVDVGEFLDDRAEIGLVRPGYRSGRRYRGGRRERGCSSHAAQPPPEIGHRPTTPAPAFLSSSRPWVGRRSGPLTRPGPRTMGARWSGASRVAQPTARRAPSVPRRTSTPRT